MSKIFSSLFKEPIYVGCGGFLGAVFSEYFKHGFSIWIIGTGIIIGLISFAIVALIKTVVILWGKKQAGA